MRVKWEAGTLSVSRRYEASKRGAGEYLRKYRFESGGLPSRSTWMHIWQGGRDAGGRQISVDLVCMNCKAERSADLAGADLTASVFNENGFHCSMLKGMACEDVTPLPRGSVYKLVVSVARDIPVHPVGTLASPAESRHEVSGDNGGSKEVEVIGVLCSSQAVLQSAGPTVAYSYLSGRTV